MKRNLDLIRDVLLAVEGHDRPTKTVEIRVEGASPEEIAYHVMLLGQAQFVDAVDMSDGQMLDWRPKSLTWQGHEFLDATRNASVWRQVKAKLSERAMDAPLAVVQELAIKYASSMLGLGK